MPSLHLIRHARPALDPTTPAGEWHLAADGSVDALRRSAALPETAAWFTSPEPKARETAALLGPASATVVADLREAGRGDGWFADPAAFERAVAGFLTDGTIPPGLAWETRAAVTARIVAAVEGILAANPGRDCVVVGHGTALTLLVASLTGAAPDAVAWRSLAMPDHCSFAREPDRLRWLSRWGEWRRGVQSRHGSGR
ncbi:MAG TPA: histidine phosphatase family protein [Kofleriaceae bacterium]|nr:histidine phosphatase family protein [Kofleriaceae bacterium]